MELLETRFYSLAEIRDITGKWIKRDVTHLLDLWGYEYQWRDRQGVTITKCPDAPMARFTELMRRHLHIDTQINPRNFACFLTLLLQRFLDYFFYYLIWGSDPDGSMLLHRFLPTAALSLVFCIPIYYLIRLIVVRLQKDDTDLMMIDS